MLLRQLQSTSYDCTADGTALQTAGVIALQTAGVLIRWRDFAKRKISFRFHAEEGGNG
jgi:hypothetical protein